MTEPTATAAILSTIRDRGPLSRAAVARHAKLSPSAVSTITRDLLNRGLVREIGTERAGMGRPSIMLDIRPEHAHFLGLSLDGTSVTAILTDLGGTVRARATHPTPDHAPDVVLDAATDLRDRLLRDAGVPSTTLAGVGVALSGLVETASGTCIDSTVMGWKDLAIGPRLRERLGLPVVVANDADAVAVGERLFGAAQGHDDFALLSIGQGIGAGIVVGGRLHRGAHGAAGELGHCTVELDGPPCRCGKRGCLEAVAAVPVILDRARRRGVDVADLAALEARAAAGDAVATEELTRAGHAIGLALSHLVNLFSPELLIITGSGTHIGPVLQAAVLERHGQHVVPMLPSLPRVLFRHEDGAVWARGAAGFATNAFLGAGGVMAGS